MKIGIVGAMSEEVNYFLKNMKDIECRKIAGNDFYSGVIGETKIVVVRSGIGKVLASMTTTLLIEAFEVDYVINSGSAGSVGRLPIGDTVIADRSVYFDVDVTAFDYEFGQIPKMPLYYLAGISLLDAAKKAILETEENYHVGLIGTGDVFVHDCKKISEIKKKFPEMLCNDMEGAAVAQVAYQYQIQSLVVRLISDTAEEGASDLFADKIQDIGEKSAEFVIKVIQQLWKQLGVT